MNVNNDENSSTLTFETIMGEEPETTFNTNYMSESRVSKIIAIEKNTFTSDTTWPDIQQYNITMLGVKLQCLNYYNYCIKSTTMNSGDVT